MKKLDVILSSIALVFLIIGFAAGWGESASFWALAIGLNAVILGIRVQIWRK